MTLAIQVLMTGLVGLGVSALLANLTKNGSAFLGGCLLLSLVLTVVGALMAIWA